MLNVIVDLFPASGVVNLHNNVTRYELREAMSELFELTVELLLADPAADMKSIVGQRALVSFPDEPVLVRVEGIVRRARQLTSEPTGTSRYEIVVVPPLWLTTRRKDHRIFQDLSVIDIVGKVLEGYGGRIDEPKNLCGDHPPREYCVQYDETDHDFIFRILAEEGIATFFDHDQQLAGKPTESKSPSTVWTLCDDTTVFSLDLPKPVPFTPPGGQNFTGPHVRNIVVTSDVETSQVALHDYDFEKPAYALRAKSDMEGEPFNNEGELEAYSYEVGQFTTDDVGRARATELLQAARALRRTLACESSFAFGAGTRMTLMNHPSDDVNGNVLVVRTRARVKVGDDDKAHAAIVLECVPAGAPFRPRRLPKARIHGTQTAFVVGKELSKDEIDVDKYGRVKVHFTWDRRDSSFEGKPTRFIRVSQGWAGQGYGLVLLPRVGDEVIVAYLEGDPDEPIIVGRVHNTVYATPLNLSDPNDHTVSLWKSRSSPADKGSTEDRFNLIRMQDKADAEMLELRAQKDFKHDTLHDSNTTVGHNQSIKVNGSQSTSAGSVSVSSGSTISMSAQTAFSATAGSTMSLHAASGLTAISDTTMGIAAGSTMGISSGSTMSIGAGAPMDLTAPMITASAEGFAIVTGAIVVVVGKGQVAIHGAGMVTVSSDGMVSVAAPLATLHGSTTATVSGPTVNIKGGTVNVEGGTVNVKGGTINLNC